MANSFKEVSKLVHFIQLIEKFPCIYDTEISANVSKNSTTYAWKQIASEFNMLVPECKEKWKHIRSAFSKAIKEKKHKKYYLAKYLQFLLPYLKAYKDLMKQPNKDENILEEITYQDNNSEHDDHRSPIDETESEIKTEPDPFDRSYENRQSLKRSSSTEQDSTEFPVVSKTWYVKPECMQSEAIEDNPRKMFLLSIMPDIEELTDEEMRVFRIDVVTSIDRIINSRRK